MNNSNKLISVNEALEIEQSAHMSLYQQYVNEIFAKTTQMSGRARRFVRAEGARLWDKNDNVYLDFFNIFGCVSLGHNHPKVIAALKAGLDAKIPLMQKLSPPHLEAVLAHNLISLLPDPLGTCYFASSGSEAIEAAIKLARGYSKQSKLLSTHDAYHGLTLGAVSLTGTPNYRRKFEPTMPGVDHIPYGDFGRLEEALKTNRYAALFLEPIQGQGGIKVPQQGYLRHARELCDKYGTLLVLDEIQTGLGRTGKLFAFEYDNIVPDILVLSKSLGGGAVPISVCITSKKIWQRVYGSIKNFLLNSNTFGGNALASLAGLATLETIVEENLTEHAASEGDYLLSELHRLQAKYPVIAEVRGRGLMIGLIFDLSSWNPLDQVSKKMIDAISSKIVTSFISSKLMNEHQIIVSPSLSSEYLIRVFPALNVQRSDIDFFLNALSEVCDSIGSYSNIFVNTLKSFIKKQEQIT